MTLAERLRRALDHQLPPDALLASDSREVQGASSAGVAAAVLVPVTARPAPGLILTQRTASLRRHAGQIAFPGGRVDASDRDAIAAALREAEEEIALAPDQVTVIGTADRYHTGTGFAVTPVIGIVPPDLPLSPNAGEVADLFEVPLDFVLDPANHREASLEWQGRTRRYVEILWQDRRIWGATAAMIVNLSRRLAWAR